MTIRSLLRLGLGYLSVVSAQLGAWALLAPKSFYDDFPGLGRVWVGVDGPYNEHLVRDVGALNLALLVLFVTAAITVAPLLIRVAAGAALVWGTPHLLYHVLNTGDLATGDVVASLGGLAMFAGIPVALLLFADRGTEVAPA